MKKYIFCIMLCLCLVGCSKSNYIELEGNPTTGYEWTCKSSNEKILKVKVDYKQKKSNNVGVGGIYKISFIPKKEGNVILVCEYSREDLNNIEDSRVYEVTVDNNLKVKYSNEKQKE